MFLLNAILNKNYFCRLFFRLGDRGFGFLTQIPCLIINHFHSCDNYFLRFSGTTILIFLKSSAVMAAVWLLLSVIKNLPQGQIFFRAEGEGALLFELARFTRSLGNLRVSQYPSSKCENYRFHPFPVRIPLTSPTQ